MNRSCRYCFNCEGKGRSDAQGCSMYGRKHYYCTNPDANPGDYKTTFVGYGDNTLESPLQLKTHPRWCPMEVKE